MMTRYLDYCAPIYNKYKELRILTDKAAYYLVMVIIICGV